MKSLSHSFRNAGFSLVEMLVVIMIISLLLGLGGWISNGLVTSMDLSNVAGDISSNLTRAKEEAHSRNQVVQVRFYKDPADEKFSMIGIGVIEPPDDPSDKNYNNPESFPFRLISKKLIIPESVTMIETAPFSTLIAGHDDAVYNIITGTEEDKVKGFLEFSAVAFSPDNRAALSNDKDWTLTLVNTGQITSADSLPDNFITLQLYPATGKTTLIQP